MSRLVRCWKYLCITGALETREYIDQKVIKVLQARCTLPKRKRQAAYPHVNPRFL